MDSNQHGDTNLDTGRANANIYGNEDAHANGNTDTDANANANRDAYSYLHGNAHRHATDCHAYALAGTSATTDNAVG